MTKTSGIGAGAGLAIGTVATVVVVGGGFFLARGGMLGEGAKAMVERQLVALGLAVPPAPLTLPADPAVSDAPVDAASADAPVDAPSTEPAFELKAPKLEVARFEPDGSGIVAASAQVGVEVQVLLDGAVLDTQTVPDAGEFVSFVTIDLSDEPRMLTLLARHNGQELASEDSFILAPMTAPAALVDEIASPEVGTDRDAPPPPIEGQEVEIAQAPDPVPAPSTDTSPSLSDSPASEHVSQPEENPQEVARAEAADVVPETTAVSEEAETATAEDTSTVASAPEEEVLAPAPAPARAVESIASAEPKQGSGTVAQADNEQVSAPHSSDVAETSDTVQAVQETNATETQAPDIAQSESAVALNTPQSAPQTGATHTRPAPQSDASVAVLRAGRDGVTLVQPARPTVPELVGKVALDTISYTDAGDVQLAGRAKPDAMVRVYLDNSPVADLETAADGQWSGNLTAISPGIYTLRLDEIDPTDGMVLSRLETPFKREAPEVLQPALAADAEPGAARPSIRAVTVQKGDTLWAISQQRYGSGYLYVRVFEANQSDIRDPDLIYPGQIFTLPE
ncbi:LysM peptidoglycan-binding domain-containing protein [Tritonibacter mobilis]|uniref:LysM peptidoglycan-binding domain-containing protein n=1 Tax=Tritonibacter mobilis TaxID=379347 RepID=UPI001CDA24BE|nr:LysM peptidoglycan-binding domain-containing protein [Tritonibacter mobilis]MCA2009177.1 LysM peptidoglycan-binding domain-containing protein [Tritonibacter mobilis]